MQDPFLYPEPRIARLGARLDTAIEGLVACILIFAPLAFGTVEAWSEQVVFLLAGGALMCLLAKQIWVEQSGWPWTMAYVPVALFLILVGIQLLPLPRALMEGLTPNTVAIKSMLLDDLPQAEQILDRTTVTFYPHATWHSLRLVWSGCVVFLVVFNAYRDTERIKRLLTLIAGLGGAIAVLALLQVATRTNKIYGLYPSGHQLADAGTFVNHSNFAQFMNIAVGAALALIFVQLHEAYTAGVFSSRYAAAYFRSPAARPLCALTGMVVLAIASVFTSLSRGGMLSLLLAIAFTTLLLGSRRSLKGRGWVMAILCLGAFICVLYVGFDAVYDRLATLQDWDQAEGGRWRIVKDLERTWRQFPLLGTGLGTHAVVYPMFDSAMVTSEAFHAENEYAQALEETGSVGLLLIAIFLAIVWRAYRQAVSGASHPICSAAYGLGFGLLAVLIHSLSDFGQHLPANFLLTATVCALLLVLPQIGNPVQPKRRVDARAHRHGRRLSALLLLVGFFSWIGVLWGGQRAWVASRQWSKALAVESYLNDVRWDARQEFIIELLDYAERAADWEPGNANYLHWLNVFRWNAISQNRDPNTGDIILDANEIGFAERIIDEFQDVRQRCPTYGPTYCMLGQLQKALGYEAEGADNILKGYTLAPNDPAACIVAGLLLAEQGKTEASYEKLSRAVELDTNLFADAAAVLIQVLHSPDKAFTLAGDNIGHLSRVVTLIEAFAGEGEDEGFTRSIRDRIETLVFDQAEGEGRSENILASMARIEAEDNNNPAAIDHYRKALAINYSQVGWRYQLAKLLATEGQVEEAMHQAKICLRVRPYYQPAIKLIEQLSTSPQTVYHGEP